MWPDESGSWGDASWDTSAGSVASGSYQQNTSVVATSAQPSDGADRWSGWFQGLITQGVNYAIAKDARESGVTYTAPGGQPVYAPAPAPSVVGGMSNGALLLIGAAIVGAVLLLKKG